MTRDEIIQHRRENKTYTCHCCEIEYTYDDKIDADERLQELETNRALYNWEVDDLIILCDNCYNKLMSKRYSN